MMVAVPPRILGRNTTPRASLVHLKMLLLVTMIGSASCSGTSNCVELGTDSFSNIKAISALAAKLGLGTRQEEAAFIVGAAKAVNDLGGKGVGVCLRSGEGDDTEFRVVSVNGNHMDRWTSVSKSMFRRPPNE